MQSIVYPSITTNNHVKFENQLLSYIKFSDYLHIDFADGTVTPNHLVPLGRMHLPENKKITLHIMVENPFLYLNQIIKLKPRRVIFPFDIGFDNPLLATELREAGIESGIYLSSADQLDDVKWQLAHFQEVMLFGGNLGKQGAAANLDLLQVTSDIKKIAPFIEIGWDGGVNESNIQQIASSGVKNIVSGGFITKSSDPEKAYAKLVSML
jgi:pentose-5-phosphate-3-epimerase